MDFQEYIVGGMAHDNFFAHHWFLGCDEAVDTEEVKTILDDYLKKINDDYAVERDAALKEVFVTILPQNTFTDYLKHIGKFGAMNKVPRVIKGSQYESWKDYLSTLGIDIKY